MDTLKETAATHAFSMGFRAMVERASQQPAGIVGYENTIESAVRVEFARMGNRAWRRDVFKGLLLLLHTKKCYKLLQNPEFITIVSNISVFGDKMVNDPSSWKLDALSPEGQLSSLIRHCFARYEVPEFMEYAFACNNRIHMLWYVQMGRGDSVKKLSGFPVEFTGRMENIFRLTTNAFTIPEAIRRAQALAYGTTEDVANVVAWSNISDTFEDETFRAEAIRFAAMVRVEIGINDLNEVWEYIFAMKAENKAYTLKGRTWAAVCRNARAWHLDMARKREAANYREWDRRMLNDFTLETEMATFKVVQLTNSVELYEEGYEMSHCVADYVQDCLDGTSAIFSLRKQMKGQVEFERLGTIELQLETRRIVQAQAKYNDELCEEAESVMQQWAAKENSGIGHEEECVANLPEAQVRAAIRAENSVALRIIVFILLKILLNILEKSCQH
ncbi:PcfJ domain-containing protein [Flavobacterium sp. J372]|uniref:PcfJ domain-containing protein n=1 Tax=Flavobacterium sp. J372 TaxID=2898436 RepID=UPI00215176CA|nr:PcfJ domain-containing protein [Flavobacterium sp. J372]MCR5861092.1 PcfJ domain-containing protein [Flavobacterium sp. J372]